MQRRYCLRHYQYMQSRVTALLADTYRDCFIGIIKRCKTLYYGHTQTHTPLAQSVGKGDVDVITPLEVSEADLALGSVGCFVFPSFSSTQVSQDDPCNNSCNSPSVTTI